MREFKVDSMGRCFVCLTPIGTRVPVPIPTKLEHEYPLSNYTSSGCSYSLQRLSSYLNMDMRKMFKVGQPIPHRLLTMVEKSRLKAELCAACVHLVQNFSLLKRQLEKIEMEVNSSLDLIHGKLLAADKTDKAEIAGSGLVEKKDILDALRKEVITKCSLKLRNVQPRVKVENLANEEAMTRHLKRHGITANGKMNQEYILPNTSYEETTDPTADIGIVKVESNPQPSTSTPDSSNPSSDSEFISDMPNNSRIKHSSHDCDLCVKKFDNVAYLNKHLKRAHTGRKFRCQKCNKTFRRSENLMYHQRRVKDCVARRSKELSKEGKFRCQLCKDKYFVEERHLDRHFKSIHLKLKEHGCNLCEMKFGRKDSLQVHMRKVHKTMQ